MKKIYFLLLMSILLVACSKEKVEEVEVPIEVVETPTQEEVEPIFPLTYTDARGKDVLIEEEVNKIAIIGLNYNLVEMLSVLDKEIVIMPIISNDEEIDEYEEGIKDLAKNVLVADKDYVVGEQDKDSIIEAIKEAKPDLIISSIDEEKNIITIISDEEAEKIAPLILFSEEKIAEDSWIDTFKEVAKAIGEEEKAEEYLEKFKENVDDLKDKLDIQEGATLARLVRDENGIAVVMKNYFGKDTFINADWGLGLNYAKESDENIKRYSLEELVIEDPDYIILDNIEDDMEDELINHMPKWKDLRAVKDKHVIKINTIHAGEHNISPISLEKFGNLINDNLKEIDE